MFSSLSIPSFLVFLCLGALTTGFVLWRSRGELSLRRHKVFDMVFLYVIFSIIAGRVIFILENTTDFSSISWSMYPYYYEPGAERVWFRQMPWMLLKFWEGGISHSVLLLGSTVTLLVFSFKNGLVKKAGYILSVALIFGHAVQIVGFFINSFYYGKPTDLAIGVQYSQIDDVFRFPVQLFELLVLGFIVILLNLIKRTKFREGILGLYLFMFSWVEVIAHFLRDSGSTNAMTLQLTQILYLLAIVLGIVLFVFGYRDAGSEMSTGVSAVSKLMPSGDRGQYKQRSYVSSYKSYQGREQSASKIKRWTQKLKQQFIKSSASE